MDLAIFLAMTIADILIIYLAFGAPIAVYKYLQVRDSGMMHRCIITAATFVFWIPAAVQIGRLYISNAYFGNAFVSPVDSDSSEILISDLRESVRSELVRLGAGVGMHDARQTVDRYVGLAMAIRARTETSGRAHENLFEAAGRRNSDLGIHCLEIRNRRRLERHQMQSRKELLTLLEDLSDFSEYSTVMRSALKLARQLEDKEMFEQLRGLMTSKAAVWNSGSKHQTQSINVVPAIVATGSLNSD
jgi:hypothetical protein